MIKTVILFVESTFNRRDYERFGIEILKGNGFNVEIWDFTPFLYPEVHNSYVPRDHLNVDYLTTFPSRENALSRIRALDRTHFIMSFIAYNVKTWRIFRLLSENNIPYGGWAFAYPIPDLAVSLKSHIRHFRKTFLSKSFNYFFTLIPNRFMGISPASILVATGEKYGRVGLPVDSTTEVVWAHTLDYDIYLKETGKHCCSKYAVFLDDYAPFHIDYTYLGIAPPISAEEYYPLLCAFFETIERQFGISVVIAAHPRSEYEKHPDYFQGRSVVRGNTCKLVRDAQFAVLHSSAAVHFAVLFNKPMIFISTKKLTSEHFQGNLIKHMAGLFSKEVITIDQTSDIDLNKELVVDEARYAQYKNDYIKRQGTEELPFWQIVANRLKKDL